MKRLLIGIAIGAIFHRELEDAFNAVKKAAEDAKYDDSAEPAPGE